MTSSRTSLVQIPPPVAPLPPADQVLCAVCGNVFAIEPSANGVVPELRCPHCELRPNLVRLAERRSLQHVLGEGPRSMREFIVPVIASVVGLLLFVSFLFGMRFLLRSNRLGHHWSPSRLAAQGEWPVPVHDETAQGTPATQSTGSAQNNNPGEIAKTAQVADSQPATTNEARDVLTYAELNGHDAIAEHETTKRDVDPNETVFDVSRPIVANNLTFAQIHARISSLQGTIFPVQCRITAIRDADGLRAPEQVGNQTTNDTAQQPLVWRHRLEVVDVEQRTLQNVFVSDNEAINHSLSWTRSGDWVVLMVTPGTAHDPLLHRVLWGLVVVDILPTPSVHGDAAPAQTEVPAEGVAE